MNPSAPIIKGLIKIHKPEHPIRPVLNWRNTLAYKLTGLLTCEIKRLAPPPTIYISNTTDPVNKLKDTPTLPHYGLASLDIPNFYTNIPVNETRDIIFNTLEHLQLDPQTRQELLGWYDVITQQNYFNSNGEILIQKEGLAMGAPTSGFLAEYFLQHLEQLHIPHLSDKREIIKYFWYVYDILVIYDTNHSDVQNTLKDFNKMHPKLKFTAECDKNNQMNFLDITINITYTDWRITAYRKPTFTDKIIP